MWLGEADPGPFCPYHCHPRFTAQYDDLTVQLQPSSFCCGPGERGGGAEAHSSPKHQTRMTLPCKWSVPQARTSSHGHSELQETLGHASFIPGSCCPAKKGGLILGEMISWLCSQEDQRVGLLGSSSALCCTSLRLVQALGPQCLI